MTDEQAKVDERYLVPGIIQAFIFISGAVVGIMTVSAGSPLLWGICIVLRASALSLSVGVLLLREA